MRSTFQRMLMLVGAAALMLAVIGAVLMNVPKDAAAQFTMPSSGFAQPLPTAEAERTFVIFPSQRITQTAYTPSPNLDTFQRDASATTGYASADVFISAIGEGDDWNLTTSIEMSADRVHWTEMCYEYWDGANILCTVPRRDQTEDGTVYYQVQLAGAFLRVVLEPTGVVTPTVTVTYRKAGNASE